MVLNQNSCRVFDDEIIETNIARSAFHSPAHLTFVVGYWGYGKTFGIGAYIICKARERGEYYLYVNMRELRKRSIQDINAMSLFDIIKTIYTILIEQQISLDQLKNVLETNIPNFDKRLASIKEYFEEDYEGQSEFIQALVGAVKGLLDSNKALYMIVDELEGVAPAIRDAVNSLCNEVRTLYDQRINFYLYVLMQRALISSTFVDGPRCEAREASSGISQTIWLEGYDLDDWRRVFEHYNVKGDLRGQAKYAKALVKLPPRLVFEILRRGKPSSVEELAELMDKILSGRREEVFIAPVGVAEARKIANNVVNNLLRNNLVIRPMRAGKDSRSRRGGDAQNVERKIPKLYTYTVNCGRNKELVLCLDLRLRRLSEAGIKCDIKVEVDDNVVVNGKPVAPAELFFAAFYEDKSSVIQGLDQLYQEVKQQVINALSNQIGQLCG